MRRREFIAGLGGAVTAWPQILRAQPLTTPVIGFLDWRAPAPYPNHAAFRQGLAQAGYVEGDNVTIQYRWGNANSARLPPLAADLVDRGVAVIVTFFAIQASLAAKAATQTIPIVFVYGGDPVKDGLVASLSRPGGNITGVTFVNTELTGKRLSLLGDLMPRLGLVGFLSGDASYLRYEEQKSQILAAARALDRQVIIVETRGDRGYEAAFRTLVERQAAALIVGPFAFPNTNKIVALAALHKIPTIYPDSNYVRDGGLMSYGADVTDLNLRAAAYTVRILSGEKPSDLPVLQATKFGVAINLKTAKTLGLEIPRILLVQANEVIE